MYMVIGIDCEPYDGVVASVKEFGAFESGVECEALCTVLRKADHEQHAANQKHAADFMREYIHALDISSVKAGYKTMRRLEEERIISTLIFTGNETKSGDIRPGLIRILMNPNTAERVPGYERPDPVRFYEYWTIKVPEITGVEE